MENKYWHLLSDKEVEQIIREKHSFSYLIDKYNKPSWCNHANPIAPGAFGCEELMNNRKNITLEYCIKCKHFKY